MSECETVVWPFFLRKHNNTPLFYCFRCKCSCGKNKRIRYSHVNAKIGSLRKTKILRTLVNNNTKLLNIMSGCPYSCPDTQHANRIFSAPLMLLSVACLAIRNFSKLSLKLNDFRTKNSEYKMCFDCLYNFWLKYFSF
jgi:hypothetical protein